jgi:nucleoside-diphosphate-sugar epimerase
MRILITGVCGMIGSELAFQLAAQGHELIGNDDLSHNCREPKELPIAQMLTCEVVQLGYFLHAIQPLDLIIHCASPVGHARLTPEAQVAWQIVSDTQSVLELAQRTGARLITFSSSEVLTYRGETDIRAQYSLGKLTGEAMVLGSAHVDGRVLRPYNVTGRHQRSDGGFVMARFREQALAGEPLTVFGSGEQVRHFLHVSDFARFVCLLTEKWPAQRRWSVCNPANKTAMISLAWAFMEAAGISGHPLIFQDGRAELANENWRDTPERALDLAAYDACVALGWQPHVTLESIVHEHLTGALAITDVLGAK